MKITTATLKAASLIAIPFTLSTAAHAASSATASTPISAQIGAGWLTNSSAKDNTSSTGLHAGLGVGLPNHGVLSPASKSSIDLDYNTNTGHGNHINVFGLEYVERVSLNTVAVAVSATGHHAVPYFGLGIGAAHNDVKKSTTVTTTTVTGGGSNGGGTTTTTTTSTVSSSKSDWHLAGKLIAGVDFGQTFVEATYAINGSTNGIRTDAVDLALGVHF